MAAGRDRRARQPATTLHVAEPPVAYARRPRIVADATVLAATVFGEDEQPQAVALLRGRALVAPHLVDYEITNVALNKVRRERLPLDSVGTALGAYMELGIERYPIDLTGVLVLAHRYRLTAYDAAYLWLAERLEAPLATFDAALARAAQLHLAGSADADGEA
jgi:predicted nucleic acid-binding protein